MQSVKNEVKQNWKAGVFLLLKSSKQHGFFFSRKLKGVKFTSLVRALKTRSINCFFFVFDFLYNLNEVVKYLWKMSIGKRVEANIDKPKFVKNMTRKISSFYLLRDLNYSSYVSSCVSYCEVMSRNVCFLFGFFLPKVLNIKAVI